MKELRFKVPNALITDKALPYSAKQVGVFLYRSHNRFGAYRKSLEGISTACGLTVPTVRKAMSILEQQGYITRERGYRYAEDLHRTVYGQTVYHCVMGYSDGFTMIPCSIFDHSFTPATFTAILYIFMLMGNTHRAWPKIDAIAAALDMGRATVCRAFSAIRRVGLLLIQHCIKRNGKYTSNSFYRLRSAAQTMIASSLPYADEHRSEGSGGSGHAAAGVVSSFLMSATDAIFNAVSGFWDRVRLSLFRVGSHFFQTKRT